MRKWVMVDIEANGPCPGLYSMVSFGAVVVEPGLERTFFGQCKPVRQDYVLDALKACGLTHEETLEYPHPHITMSRFRSWLSAIEGPMFVSDNNGFDWQFINYYFHNECGANPFGHSSTNLGSLYKGVMGSMFKTFKHLRKTKHTHNPLDDAMGNAEAMLSIAETYGVKGLI